MSKEQITQISKVENKKANAWFLTNTLYVMISMIAGFFLMRFTINLFGEPTSGVTRFFMQIITYVNVLNGGIFIIFSIGIIDFYKKGDSTKILWLAKWLGQITRKFSTIFFILLILVCLIPAYSFYGSSLTFSFIYTLCFVIGLNLFFTLLFLAKNSVILTSTNNGYIFSGAAVISRIIVYVLFVIIVYFRPPQLEVFLVDGKKVLDFSKGVDIKSYALVLGYIILAVEPILTYFIIKIYMRKNLLFQKIDDSSEISNEEKIKMKKTIFKGISNALLLNATFLLLYNTDDFALLLLKESKSTQRVLQIITIFGLYSSMSLSLRTVLIGFIESKKVLIASKDTSSFEHQKFMKDLKTNAHFLGSIFLASSIIFMPVVARIFFQPVNSTSYADLHLSVPFSIFSWMIIINDANKLELELSNRLRFVSFAYLIEAIVNVSLTFGLVVKLGVYWVIWASVIASTIKIIIFEIFSLAHWKNYKSQFLINLNKTTLYSTLLYTIVLIEIVISYTIDTSIIFDGAMQYFSYFVFAFLGIFDFIFAIFLIFKTSKVEAALTFLSLPSSHQKNINN